MLLHQSLPFQASRSSIATLGNYYHTPKLYLPHPPHMRTSALLELENISIIEMLDKQGLDNQAVIVYTFPWDASDLYIHN